MHTFSLILVCKNFLLQFQWPVMPLEPFCVYLHMTGDVTAPKAALRQLE